MGPGPGVIRLGTAENSVGLGWVAGGHHGCQGDSNRPPRVRKDGRASVDRGVRGTGGGDSGPSGQLLELSLGRDDGTAVAESPQPLRGQGAGVGAAVLASHLSHPAPSPCALSPEHGPQALMAHLGLCLITLCGQGGCSCLGKPAVWGTRPDLKPPPGT